MLPNKILENCNEFCYLFIVSKVSQAAIVENKELDIVIKNGTMFILISATIGLLTP